MTRPVLFGEVLFDRFPGGEAVLGGAPFNVAWHLQAFGLEPLFVSRVGDDDAGREVLAAVRAWGLDPAGVQVDRERPTGVVEVRLERGEPSYAILPDQAYDHVRADELPELPADLLLYHGTLALRSAGSRAAFEALARRAGARRVVDVNLRDPWWDRADVLALLRDAAIVKLNEDELARVGDAAADDGAAAPPGDAPEALERAARALLERCGAGRLVVTRGERGASVFDRERAPVSRAAPPVSEVVDTVGAGDAFTAVLILGECRGWEPDTTLARGLELAAAFVGLRGATTTDLDFYRDFLRRWAHP